LAVFSIPEKEKKKVYVPERRKGLRRSLRIPPRFRIHDEDIYPDDPNY